MEEQLDAYRVLDESDTTLASYQFHFESGHYIGEAETDCLRKTDIADVLIDGYMNNRTVDAYYALLNSQARRLRSRRRNNIPFRDPDKEWLTTPGVEREAPTYFLPTSVLVRERRRQRYQYDEFMGKYDASRLSGIFKDNAMVYIPVNVEEGYDKYAHYVLVEIDMEECQVHIYDVKRNERQELIDAALDLVWAVKNLEVFVHV